MEALLALLADLVIPLAEIMLVTMGTIVGELIVAIVTLGMNLVWFVVSICTGAKRHERESGPPARTASQPARPQTDAPGLTTTREPQVAKSLTKHSMNAWRRWSRRVLIIGLAVLGLTVAGLVVVDLWFLEDVVRWAFRRHEQRTGLALTATTVRGSLFTGRLHLEGVAVHKPGPAATIIAMRVEAVDLDLRITSALVGKVIIDDLALRGLTGSVARTPSTVKRSGVTIKGITVDLGADRQSIEIRRSPTRPGRAFRIERLTIERADLGISDVRVDAEGNESAFTYRLEIDRLACVPLRSEHLLFDALYRTNAQGRIDGAPFTLATGERPGGRWTTWDFQRIPVALLGMAGGPLRLITGGSCSLHADDTWTDSGDRTIHMHYRLVFSDLAVALPESWTGLRRTLAAPVVAYLSRRAGRIPLEFTCTLDGSRFDLTSSLELTGLGKALWHGLTHATAPERSDPTKP